MRPIDIVQAKGTSTAVQLYELMGCHDDDEGLSPQPEWKMMVGSWLTAVENYDSRNWDGAIAALNDHLIFWPEDRAAHELLRRAEGSRKFPPPLDWDGIEKLLSK